MQKTHFSDGGVPDTAFQCRQPARTAASVTGKWASSDRSLPDTALQ